MTTKPERLTPADVHDRSEPRRPVTYATSPRRFRDPFAGRPVSAEELAARDALGGRLFSTAETRAILDAIEVEARVGAPLDLDAADAAIRAAADAERARLEVAYRRTSSRSDHEEAN